MAGATNYVDQIMELEAQKQAILSKAKSELLNAAERAVADLNNLGFQYTLVEGSTAPNVMRGASKGEMREARSPRQGGVSDRVLEAVRAAPEGLARAGVLTALNADDTKAEQSISNALSNLKKAGKLTAENGVYKAT